MALIKFTWCVFLSIFRLVYIQSIDPELAIPGRISRPSKAASRLAVTRLTRLSRNYWALQTHMQAKACQTALIVAIEGERKAWICRS
ncbi:hypothetical protein B0H67DRAFT_146886 [Lasiosphaeris hirsuta]|uniref:Secreted protein n=1 Tax=Lasiosphaeris hirsuta TaxID=260670 RepID=A0AA40B1S4_9PEZI|nr:hypothetical protein B0H67DRAFT_146886 [Lasiosphaeris hirsuta]